jgi:hypothetical protein
MVNVVSHGGTQRHSEKLRWTSEGKPEAAKLTASGEPETKALVIFTVQACPWNTVTLREALNV